VRRIEWFAGLITSVAGLAAILATLFLPIGRTFNIIDGHVVGPVTPIYARSQGWLPVVVTCLLIVVLSLWILIAAYQHALRGVGSARVLLWVGTLAYFLVGAWTLRLGSFAEYPALVAVVCSLFALLPSRLGGDHNRARQLPAHRTP
jgi:hypothetical protein